MGRAGLGAFCGESALGCWELTISITPDLFRGGGVEKE